MTQNEGLLSFGGHLEVLRRMLFRVLGVTFVFSCIIFFFKSQTFEILLAPSDSTFVTYRLAESTIRHLNDGSFSLDPFDVDLITTDLSSQFVNHISTSIYLGLLCASPLVVYELFRFISPALYENEKVYSTRIAICIYLLFLVGILMSYFVLFPVSFRFLGTYSVADKVHSTITLDSYISTFISLTLLMGLVFQLPVVAFILSRMKVLNSRQMAKYRKHAVILILLISAIITPPDVITLALVAIPLYCLYEISILVCHSKTTKRHVPPA